MAGAVDVVSHSEIERGRSGNTVLRSSYSSASVTRLCSLRTVGLGGGGLHLPRWVYGKPWQMLGDWYTRWRLSHSLCEGFTEKNCACRKQLTEDCQMQWEPLPPPVLSGFIRFVIYQWAYCPFEDSQVILQQLIWSFPSMSLFLHVQVFPQVLPEVQPELPEECREPSRHEAFSGDRPLSELIRDSEGFTVTLCHTVHIQVFKELSHIMLQNTVRTWSSKRI